MISYKITFTLSISAPSYDSARFAEGEIIKHIAGIGVVQSIERSQVIEYEYRRMAKAPKKARKIKRHPLT